MSKIMSIIRRAPKRFSALGLMIAAAIIIPSAVLAWGPNRDTFTIERPADRVVFNSITNNPNYGDERNFVTIKDAANTAAGGWKDEINVENGKEYWVRMYVHNNAAANLNLVAENVTAKFNLPTYESNRIQIDGYLSSTNADPGQVWDQAVFTGAGKFSLDYIEGSASYTNNVFPAGTTLPDSVVGGGAKLGYDKMDGKIPGCFQYDGAVIFKVKVQQSNFDVQKTVRVNGASDTTFKENVAAKPGDKVDYQIYFKNTGSTQLKDVVIKDTLPAGVTYVPGTTQLYNANGLRTVADGVTTSGINIGGYLGGAEAYIKFTAKIGANDTLPKCGDNILKNIAKATTGVGSKEDGANVTVPKECLPTVKYKCDSLKIDTIDRTNFKFTTNYTVENATFKSVTYTIRNANGTVVDTKTSTTNTLNYTQGTAGTYSVQAVVTVTVDGQDKVAPGDCKGTFKVPEVPPTKITVCELATKKIVTIDEKDFDPTKYSKNLADCKEVVKKIKVCEIATKQIVIINEADFNPAKYTTDLSKCKETPPTKIEVCEIATKTIVTIDEKDFDASKYTKDLSKCESTPVTPPELPQTGAGENIVAILGLGALIASIAYYVASRRALNQ